MSTYIAKSTIFKSTKLAQIIVCKQIVHLKFDVNYIGNIINLCSQNSCDKIVVTEIVHQFTIFNMHGTRNWLFILCISK